jgi:small subunit ribosomal protein SAe
VLYYMLAKMVLQMRGSLPYGQPWDVMVDLFFYRDPEEVEKQQQEEEAALLTDGTEFTTSADTALPSYDAALEAPVESGY